MRRVTFSLLFACLAAPVAWGQSLPQSAALPPSTESLDRLRLKMQWAIHVPIDGRTDSLTQVQVADGDQIFVQTKSGNFACLDARTGQRTWAYRFATSRAESHPAAINSQHVFLVNLSTVYCFHRYSGLLEFKFEPTIVLGKAMSTISSGPACDEEFLYLVVGNRDLLAYRLPKAITQPDPAASKDALAAAGRATGRIPNPADMVVNRYPGRGQPTRQIDDDMPSRGIPSTEINVNSSQVSPSVNVLPSVTPPYQLRDRNGLNILKSESLTPLNSLRHPYRIYDAEGRYVVKSPSVSVIPPSVARAHELNDIRPKGLEPNRIWRYEATNRIAFAPTITGPRLWLTFHSARALALDRLENRIQERIVQTDGSLSSPASAPMAVNGKLGYLPLADGSLIAIDLTFGGVNKTGALKQIWRANVGGPMNRDVVLTPNSAYVGGTISGIGRIDLAAGELNWRTDGEDDYLYAVNDESVYVRSNKGHLRVYDQKSPVDPITKETVPVGEINVSGFNIPVTNPINDRILLASDNGMIVCLRDAAPKYALPKPTLPKPAPAPVEKKDDAKPATAPEAPMTPATPKSPMADPAK